MKYLLNSASSKSRMNITMVNNATQLNPCFRVVFVLSNRTSKTTYYVCSTEPSMLFISTKWVPWNPED